MLFTVGYEEGKGNTNVLKIINKEQFQSVLYCSYNSHVMYIPFSYYRILNLQHFINK